MTRLDPQDRVPNHWLLSIFRVPHLAPHARGALAATNLPPDTLDEIGTEIPRGVEAQILDYLAGHLNTPYYGAEIGVSLDPRNTSLLTYILFNSTTLREALYHVKHFAPVTRPRAIVEIRETPTHVDFVVDGLGPNLMLDTHFVEFTLGAMLGAFRTATGTARLCTLIGVSNPRRTGRNELAEIYRCRVDLDAEASHLRFSSEALNLPILDADADLLGHLKSYGEVLLRRAPRRNASLTHKIERHVLHGMATGRPALSRTASTFGMSERTLTRRLLEEGTSFRAIVSDAQLKLATAYLGDPHLSLAEVAHLCGFSSQSSFTQAYGRWTGHTPKMDRISLKNR